MLQTPTSWVSLLFNKAFVWLRKLFPERAIADSKPEAPGVSYLNGTSVERRGEEENKRRGAIDCPRELVDYLNVSGHD